jgi:hypothetical protein
MMNKSWKTQKNDDQKTMEFDERQNWHPAFDMMPKKKPQSLQVNGVSYDMVKQA